MLFVANLWRYLRGKRTFILFLIYSVACGVWAIQHRPISLEATLFIMGSMSVLGFVAFACVGWAIVHPVSRK